METALAATKTATTTTMETITTPLSSPLPLTLTATTAMEVTSNTRATSSPSPTASTPPTPNVTFEISVNQQQLNKLQQPTRALITTATQTALKRHDIPTMYHFDYDDCVTNDGKISLNEESSAIGASTTDLAPCPICSRKFNSASLSKHVNICQKMAAKKRKPFDSSRQRREGTEMASFLPKNFGLPASKQIPESSPADEKFVRSTARASTRKQSNASIASNSSMNTSSNTSMPASPKPTRRTERHSSTERPKRGQPTPPASEQCPHCERFFGLKAYDRHVEWCKEKSLQAAIKNSSCSEKEKAKERLAARTKYRAPIKTKRSLNREKYSGIAGDENEGDESPKICSSNSVMSSSVASDRIEDDNISQSSLEFSKDSLKFFEHSVTPKNQSECESHATLGDDQNSLEKSVYNIVPKQRSATPRPSNLERRDDGFRVMHNRIDQLSTHAEEVETSFSQPMTSYQLPRQYTDPNLNRNAMYTAHYPYNVSNICSPMQMQQQQNTLQASYQNLQNAISFDNFYASNNSINLQINALHFNRRLKKLQRKQEMLAENFRINSSIPMKAFNLPIESVESLDMIPPPLDLETVDCELTDFDNKHLNRGGGDGDIANTLHGATQENKLENIEAQAMGFKSTSKAQFHVDVKSALGNSSYDPFLAAKRQLEELCAPDSPPDNDTRFNTKTVSTPTTPSPIIPTAKMTTSLTFNSSTSTPHTNSSPLTPNANVRKTNTNMTTPTSSNFRRTSSLRGPRRSPLLPARPLFAQKRPTIQRGLSDEGPISTNFLKSEEYDEIPVRSVCVNDFAITNSPRVVRRDTSLSNRKNSLKLSFNNGTSDGSTNQQSNVGITHSDEKLTLLNAPKELSKTDSLAVFLKYEREMEKLANDGITSDTNQFPWESISGNEVNNKMGNNLDSFATVTSACNDKTKTKPETTQTNLGSTQTKFDATQSMFDTTQTKRDTTQSKYDTSQLKFDATPVPKVDTTSTSNSILAFTKELKNKSNNLNKQNSAKSLKLDTESIENLKPTQESPPLTQEIQKPKIEHQFCSPHNVGTEHSKKLRLEPIERSSQIPQPVNNNNNIQTTKRPHTALPPLSQQSSISTTGTQPPVNLESIFGNSKPQQQSCQLPPSSSSSSYDKENKIISSSTEYIDPKLINKCDNLPVKLADLKFIDSDSSTEQQRCDRATDPYEHYVSPISQLSKLMPLTNKSNENPLMSNAQTQSTPTKHTKVITNSIGTSTQQHQVTQKIQPVSNAQRRSSIESLNNGSIRNPLKRKMRLGRNQFLYDASPEALDVDSACSADDEANPRSSAEYDTQLHSTFEQMLHQQAPQFQANTMPPPIFVDFDFDEFLSSFENDGEDFPLFRDCREFLKNRTTLSKQRATTASAPNNTINIHVSTPKQIQTPNLNTNNNNNFFQFPTLNRNLPHLVNSSTSTRRSNSKTSTHGFKDMLNDTTKSDDYYSARSEDSNSNSFHRQGELGLDDDEDDNDNDVVNNQKREIFISIETEQNDELCNNPISPNSLRNMVGGNSQTLVEVEVDANDNKFSKISDDDDENSLENNNNVELANSAEQARVSANILPNVKFNNAKNLMQQVHSDERGDYQRQNQQQKVASGVSTIDSDDMSSLDGYSFNSSNSFRRSAGVASKTSADSAYGSLSRQRSNEAMGKPTQRSSSRTRPATAGTGNVATNKNVNITAGVAQIQQKQFLLQQQYQQHQQQLMLQQQQQQLKYAQAMMKGLRTRQSSASSSSSSDNSLPPILVANPNHFQQQQQILMQQQQQQISHLYQQNKARSRVSPTAATYTTMDMLNANHPTMMTPATSNSSNISGTTTKPMSRFCHECGSKFLVEHAKFCMDCGVKRLMI